MKYILVSLKVLFVCILSLSIVSCKEKIANGINGKVCFFPQGDKILFTVIRDGVSNIYVHDFESEKISMITNNKDPKYFYNQPSLSPDGYLVTFAAMQSETNNGSHIHIMNVNGSKIRKLTNGRRWDHSPVFSADGKVIVFSRVLRFTPKKAFGSTSSDADLYTIHIDGTKLRKITNESFLGINSISVSKTDNLVLLSAILGRADFGLHKLSKYYPLLFLIDLQNPAPIKPLISIHEKGYWESEISPDGNKILFITRIEDFNYDLFMMSIDGSNIKRLTDLKSYLLYPTFSPDMKKVFFLSDKERNKNYKLMKMDINGSHIQEITLFNN